MYIHSLFSGTAVFTMILSAAARTDNWNTFASRVDRACQDLSNKYPESILLPTSASFLNETRNFWDIRSAVAPACIFFPGSADEVAGSVSVLTSHEAQFAIRGGGHMNVSFCSGPNNYSLCMLTRRSSFLDQTTLRVAFLWL